MSWQHPNDEHRFPDITPIQKPPHLVQINGCGTGIYGSRDVDPMTGSYVTTLCLCLLFIPLLALRAYRVVDAGDGSYYFLGRAPLSRFSKFWNVFFCGVVFLTVGLVSWNVYTGTEDYKAGQQLKKADELAYSGQAVEAALLYREVALGKSSRKDDAVEKFRALMESSTSTIPLADAARVFTQAVAVEKTRPGFFSGVADIGLHRLKKDLGKDPRAALTLVDAIAQIAPRASDLPAVRQRVLEKLVLKEPENPVIASRLASIYEQQGQREKCKKLLLPHLDRLGTHEGARILGQILVREGKFDKAHALLLPYTEGRLQVIDQNEKRMQGAFNRLVNQIKQGKAEDFPYGRMKNASKGVQQQIFQEYLDAQMKKDPEFKKLQEADRQAGVVVEAALDLGIVLLHRAQAMTDPDKRQAELKQAEKMFLAIRRQKGESVAYQLHLGKVYYWLGKPAEGHKLLEKALEKANRAPALLVQVSVALRRVGENTEARQLAEEAYNKETDPRKKADAASMRAMLNTDTDDRITWLKRADPDSNPQVQANLSAALGIKALQEGQGRKAADHLRKAVQLYKTFPVHSATLNNGALVHFALFQATGEREHLTRGVAMMEKAIALEPDNSILVLNVATTILRAAVRDIIGDKINLEVLRVQADTGYLSYLYKDQAGLDDYVGRMRKHPGVAKARTYLDRSVVLAPKRPFGYHVLWTLAGFLDDTRGLQDLARRLQKTQLDQADYVRQTREAYEGKDDARRLKEMRDTLKYRREALQKARKEKPGPTFAVAACLLVNHQVGMAQWGLDVNLDEVVALAEEAHVAAPSSATASTLIGALLARASKDLVSKNPTYAEMVNRTRRSLSPSYVLAAALERGGPFVKVAQANKDVQRALTLVRDQIKLFPQDPSVYSWALLRNTYPKDAETLASLIAKDETQSVNRTIEAKLSPLSVSLALKEYWTSRMAGNEKEAMEILSGWKASKVPLPFAP